MIFRPITIVQGKHGFHTVSLQYPVVVYTIPGYIFFLDIISLLSSFLSLSISIALNIFL